MDAMKKDGNLFIKMMQLSLSSLYKDYIYIYKQKNYYKIIIQQHQLDCEYLCIYKKFNFFRNNVFITILILINLMQLL